VGEWNGPEEERHELTEEERQRGRENVTPRKRKALALNATKHGGYSKVLASEFDFCDSCVYKSSCLAYRASAACSLKIEILKQINKVATGSSEAWLAVSLRSLQDLFVLAKQSQRIDSQKEFVKLWLELGKILFPKQIQINEANKEIKVVFDDGRDNQD
jgi:hypothetical protein